MTYSLRKASGTDYQGTLKLLLKGLFLLRENEMNTDRIFLSVRFPLVLKLFKEEGQLFRRRVLGFFVVVEFFSQEPCTSW